MRDQAIFYGGGFSLLAGIFCGFASSSNYWAILSVSFIFCLGAIVAFSWLSPKASAGMRWGSRLGIAIAVLLIAQAALRLLEGTLARR
jgi:hypothetical protein